MTDYNSLYKDFLKKAAPFYEIENNINKIHKEGREKIQQLHVNANFTGKNVSYADAVDAIQKEYIAMISPIVQEEIEKVLKWYGLTHHNIMGKVVLRQSDSEDNIKILGINSLVLGISMTHIDVILKILLLLVSIGYTIHKWYLMNGKNK